MKLEPHGDELDASWPERGRRPWRAAAKMTSPRRFTLADPYFYGHKSLFLSAVLHRRLGEGLA
jgi:hypothetical protein